MYRDYPLDGWAVFRNLADTVENRKWWLKPLKPGFKHVELWLNDRDVWLRLDPCFELPTLQAHLAPPQDLIDPALEPTFVRIQTTLHLGTLSTPWVWGPLTCVDAVKLGLGIRTRLFTPYQLYRHLTKGP